ncbi:hypothetical protein AB832_06785 [Flavobacteriaceae bacterium (ex Bugula neritina AB1)]|nr:hypothetical protein AB832_06785 [Flavobacteriaceae bacterium (ex Bugula neritina AB1)]
MNNTHIGKTHEIPVSRGLEMVGRYHEKRPFEKSMEEPLFFSYSTEQLIKWIISSATQDDIELKCSSDDLELKTKRGHTTITFNKTLIEEFLDKVFKSTFQAVKFYPGLTTDGNITFVAFPGKKPRDGSIHEWVKPAVETIQNLYKNVLKKIGNGAHKYTEDQDQKPKKTAFDQAHSCPPICSFHRNDKYFKELLQEEESFINTCKLSYQNANNIRKYIFDEILKGSEANEIQAGLDLSEYRLEQFILDIYSEKMPVNIQLQQKNDSVEDYIQGIKKQFK